MKTSVLFITFAMCFITPASVMALDCAPIPLEEHRESAEVIFAGTVSSIGARGSDSMSVTPVVFETNEIWKGMEEGVTSLTVHISSWDLSLLEEEKAYLVYATHSEFGLLHVNPCGGRIVPEDQTAQDRVLLGESLFKVNRPTAEEEVTQLGI